jgi:predicted hydrolase (HD superfamily)
MDREKLLKILEKQIENKNIIKHMLATEACMRVLAEKLGAENKEEWAMAGLMHDGDYRDDVPVEQQGVKIAEIMRDEGIEVPESVAHAMAAHNWRNTGVEPKSLMDWALFTCDSLTGLIVAATLVLPSRKLADLKVENVLHRFKEKSFARGTRREDIALCEEKLGIPLEEFVKICLKAMRGISRELGL